MLNYIISLFSLIFCTSAFASSPDCKLYFEKENLCAIVVWSQTPKAPKLPQEKDQIEFTLKFWNKSQGSSSGPYQSPKSKILVKLWMPSMDHGSLETQVVAEPNQPGIYQVKKVLFSMPGDWEIRIKLKKDEKVFEEKRLQISIQS